MVRMVRRLFSLERKSLVALGSLCYHAYGLLTKKK
jgi:hypothetical protein